MYNVVRNPPLSTAKKANAGASKGEVDPLSPSAVMPSVPRTVPPRNYGHRTSGSDALQPQTQRGGASPYQTTNALFSGSVVPSKPARSGSTPATPEEGRGGEGPNGTARVPARALLDRNASDNVAAVLGGSTLFNGGRLGVQPHAPSGGAEPGFTRKAFSGPPSTRNTAGAQMEPTAQRMHPPGSGGSKSRPNPFGMNTNQQRLLPMPQRSPNAGGKGNNNSNSYVKSGPGSPRRPKGVQQQQQQQRGQSNEDIFGVSQRLNGTAVQLVQTDGGDLGRRAGPTATPFTLASVKPQHIMSPHMPPTSRSGMEEMTLSRTRSLGSSSRLMGDGARFHPDDGISKPAGVNNSNTTNGSSGGGGGNDNGNNNGLLYEFRVLASTGKTCTMPIKLSVGIGSLQGLRPTMEDQHFVRLNAAAAAGQHVSVLGILDGHCGRRVAELAARHVPDNFLAHTALGENNALAFVESIIQADRSIFHAVGKGPSTASGCSNGGSTLITAAVHGRMLHVACLGDARAVLYDGNVTIPMSEDHKPTARKEHSRILQCGGFVQFGRVCGVLAVSRALGDYEFKFNGSRFDSSRQLMVSNVADVRQINLTDSSKFLVLACDGLWDVVENEEATQFVRDFLSYTPDVGSSPEATKRALNNCCQKLAEFAVDRGSTDNVSVVILFFHDVEEVVASFDKPVGVTRVSGPSNSPNSVSPRLAGASRGLSGDCSANAAFGASRRGPFNPNNASWYGRSRSLW